MAIAEHYPKPYPSQGRLAEGGGCDVRSIRRYQALCQDLGLLHVTVDAGAKGKGRTWSKTHRYHIITQDKLSGMCEDNLSYKEPKVHYVHHRLDASLSSSAKKKAPPRPPSAGSNVILMRRDQEPTRQVSKKAPATPKAADLLTPGASRRGQRRVPAKKQRWQVLAEYFSASWLDLIAHPDNKDLREVRDVENQAQCRSYINARFAERSDTEVRAMIDEFMRAVSQRVVKIKSGQSAWLCFTGAWGRNRQADHTVANKALREYVPPSERAQ